jgi:aspartate carbamoyltransferase catalytic subunit
VGDPCSAEPRAVVTWRLASGDESVTIRHEEPPAGPESAPARPFRLRSLLTASDLQPEEVETILNAAESFFEVSRRSVRKVPTLRGKTLLNVFFEASTRTRTSFELAGKRLSMDTVNLAGSSSSTTKGETLLDTIKTLEAMQPDIVVIRHAASGAAEYVARRSRISIVNAGDGTHEHPSQALLDAFTIRRHKQRFAGLKVAICGDILHSRVARSNAYLLSMLGADVHLAGPETLMPFAADSLGSRVKVHSRIEPALEGADVVMVLRIQRERLQGAFLPSTREYARTFGLSPTRLKLAKSDAIVMHPGPMNRGVEISADVADGASSVILDQVEAGVAVRMAILWLLSGSAS